MKRSSTILVVLGLLLLYGASIVLVRQKFTTRVPGANDFYARWKGAQLFIREGIDPYSSEAAEATQRGMFGRPALPTEDQALFVYPLYTIFTIVPLVWLPYDWVQAIWLVTLLFVMLLSMFILLRLLQWRMPTWLLAVIMVWTVLFYNSARTILLGQYAALVFLGIVGCLLALRRERDGLAGALLALTTIKPQMVFLLIPVLLLWGLGRRRWRFVISFGVAMFIVVGASFLLLPSWLSGFIEQVRSYPGYTFTGSPLWVLTGVYFPRLGKPVEQVLIVLSLLYLIYRGRALPRQPAASTEFLIIISITLIVTNMIVVRTATTNYIVMYIPLMMGLQVVARKYGNGAVAAILALSIVGFWLLFLSTIQGDTEHPIMYLPLPLGLLALLMFGGGLLRRYAASFAPAESRQSLPHG